MCLTEFKSFYPFLVLHLDFQCLADCFYLLPNLRFFCGGEQLYSVVLTDFILSLSNFTAPNLCL